MARSKLVKANKKIADTVVGGYKKLETSVVTGFNRICDWFVDYFLTQVGETVEEARARLAQEQQERDVRAHRNVHRGRGHANQQDLSDVMYDRNGIPHLNGRD